ncbi:RNA polymerase subunit sigma-70 [Longibacter salinarum]|uniref:RNA polymerase subunit sigma-70 n=2 Tax=Longibacter salinarum TaxID=1850348 RepID=A0A2A8CTD0_9BACT|nr:RNA polymerase subunit sigma-70 [Longibacter salinarum]
MATTADVTTLLGRYQNGDRSAGDQLWQQVYQELRQVAHRRLLGERAGHTLGTTALVHECYLRLIDQTQVEWQSRLHFFAMASRVMRNILVDYARRKKAQKRGGDAHHLQLEDVSVAGQNGSADLFLALDRALDQLEEVDERLARVVEYRFFGGMKEKEIAELLDVSARTIRRDWRKAKLWLARALKEDE